MTDLKELAKVVEMAKTCEGMAAITRAAIQVVLRSNTTQDLTINKDDTPELFTAIQESIVGALEERKAELIATIHQETQS